MPRSAQVLFSRLTFSAHTLAPHFAFLTPATSKATLAPVTFTSRVQRFRTKATPVAPPPPAKPRSKPRKRTAKSQISVPVMDNAAKNSRRRSESQETAATQQAPPPKKAVFSIFQKQTDTSGSTAASAQANIHWKTHGTSFIVGKTFNPKASSKVAAFDLDSTLIKVNGKHKWPKNSDDWVWWCPQVPARLKEIAATDHTIVIITNQNGLDGNASKQVEMKQKFEKISGRLGPEVPMWILISMQKDHYRKPMTGLWHWLEDQFRTTENVFEDGTREAVVIDRSQSYYVGDAAGRHDGWKVGAVKDFNNTDRKFAATLRLPFHTPEHFFLNQDCPEDKWSFGKFDPKAWPKLPLFSPTSTPLLPAAGTVELIVFCGYPASGKSSFAQKHILSTGCYEYVNQDILKTRDKCLRAVSDALVKSKSVVVDNTNPDVATRAPYIALARKHNVPVRCFLFMADRELAVHNNYFRAFHRPLVQAATASSGTSSTTTETTVAVSTTNKHQESSSASTTTTSTTTTTTATTTTVLRTRDEPERERLSEMVFASYSKRYQEPTLQEGFSEIKKINFVPDEDIKETWETWYV